MRGELSGGVTDERWVILAARWWRDQSGTEKVREDRRQQSRRVYIEGLLLKGLRQKGRLVAMLSREKRQDSVTD